MAQENGTDKKAQFKVELDLDDAPFLEDEPEKEEKAAPAAKKAASPAEPAPSATPAPKLSARKKKLIIAGAGGAGIIVLAVLAGVFLFSGKAEPPPPPEITEEHAKAPPPPAQEYTMQWEPFWVEMKDTEGATRFLTIKFTVPTTNPIVFAEMNARKLVLRDALFYYLRQQPALSLSDAAKAAALKSDLLTVINEHLASGKVSDILIQDYLLQ